MSELYKVELLEAAEEDLADIGKYIRQFSPSAANKIIDWIHGSLSQLALFPYMGTEISAQKANATGYRMLVIDKYIVIYKVLESIIEIIMFFHSNSSKLSAILKRQD